MSRPTGRHTTPAPRAPPVHDTDTTMHHPTGSTKTTPGSNDFARHEVKQHFALGRMLSQPGRDTFISHVKKKREVRVASSISGAGRGFTRERERESVQTAALKEAVWGARPQRRRSTSSITRKMELRPASATTCKAPHNRAKQLVNALSQCASTPHPPLFPRFSFIFPSRLSLKSGFPI